MHTVNRKLLHLFRTLHIYLTMLGVFVMLLFGITGFTVNHEDWFRATIPRVVESTAQTPLELVAKKDALRIVEHLRQSQHVTGAMTAFDELDGKFSVGFKSPGQIWEIEIDKATGATRVHEETFNFFALINNLHRGRYSGAAWRWVIDLSAILIVLACATGFVLWLALPKRRKLGVLVLLLGTLGVVAIYLALVPGQDAPVEPPAAIASP
ncbi:MAG: PepSY-associated TM helix domain-containing protein [Verrucomicrobiota bacterium]